MKSGHFTMACDGYQQGVVVVGGLDLLAIATTGPSCNVLIFNGFVFSVAGFLSLYGDSHRLAQENCQCFQ
jgi:hypothetical protein